MVPSKIGASRVRRLRAVQRMSTNSVSLKPPKTVRRKVTSLRWLIRAYVALEGLSVVFLVLGIAFWLGLAFDWAFEPSRGVRLLLSLVLGISLVFISVRHLLGRVFARLSDISLALLVERAYPEFNDSLITTIEGSKPSRGVTEGNEHLLLRTREIAETTMGEVRLGNIFRFRPLIWKLLMSVFLVLSIVTFAFRERATFDFWLERIQLSETLWPRLVSLTVSGFELEGDTLVAHVARDDDFELQVMASIADGHKAPEEVEVRYLLTDGRHGRHSMTKIGEALPGRDESQEFRFTFNNLADDLEFDIRGGDDRIRHLLLRVVERPQIVEWRMECRPPEYLRRAEYSRSFSHRIELEEGTKAICRLEANKRITTVDVHEPAKEQGVHSDISEDGSNQFSFPIDVEQEDRVFLINMVDEDGVRNREPYRMVVSAITDEPPEVSIRLRGIGSAVTSQASIPLEGLVRDEYGVEELWFEYQVDEGQILKQRLEAASIGSLEISQFPAFDLQQATPSSHLRFLDLHPGQKLTLSILARDAYDLGESANIGSSPRFLLSVVTESELRALLEKRELALRQRFEALVEKMLGIQELLQRVQVDDENRVDSAIASDEKQRVRDLLRIDGAMQSVVQISFETIGVAEGFQDIVTELVNNRIDNEELKERLISGISDPLMEIGEELLPELEERLQTLHASFSDSQNAANTYHLVLVQGEIVLDAMQKVLDRMLELENYNELVELLRGIVRDQKELQEETKRKRLDKLRSLLDDE